MAALVTCGIVTCGIVTCIHIVKSGHIVTSGQVVTVGHIVICGVISHIWSHKVTLVTGGHTYHDKPIFQLLTKK